MQAEITIQETSKQPRCTIYRLHSHLRSINDKAYDPEIISIGPYHRGKTNLRMLEAHKSLYKHLLLQQNKDLNDEMFASAIKPLEEEARRCYAEPISLNSSDFIRMLVLDGCFIVQLVRKYDMAYLRENDDPIFHLDWIMNSLQRDLMLFENQIPFFVLVKIYELIEVQGQHSRFMYLVLRFFSNIYPGKGCREKSDRRTEKVKHLLDLIHGNWRHPTNVPGDNNVNEDTMKSAKKVWRFIESAKKLKEANVPDDNDVNEDRMKPARKVWRFIESAKKLKEANVKFQRSEEKNEVSLFDLSFQHGTMTIVPLTVEDRTEAFLRNLIALEQYQDCEPCFVTDYAKFMDCLIDTSQDVEILSKCGVIENWLGDDEAVVSVFNKLTDSVTGPGKHFVYGDIFDRVNKHCNKHRNRWLAMLRRNYLHSPWGVLSIVAALVLLVLTVIQTVCSILQVV